MKQWIVSQRPYTYAWVLVLVFLVNTILTANRARFDPPPFEWTEPYYVATPERLCPTDNLTYTAESHIHATREHPIVVETTRTIWDTGHNRTFRGDFTREEYIWHEDLTIRRQTNISLRLLTLGSGYNLTTTPAYMLDPILPPGDYEYRVAGGQSLSEKNSYYVKFTIKPASECGG